MTTLPNAFRALTAVLLAGALAASVLVSPSVAGAEDPVISAGMPTQASMDLASTDPANTMHSAGWADLAGGVEARPFVKSLTVLNGDTVTSVIADGTTVASRVPIGEISTVISPFNLCTSDQTPMQGVCYGTPNRVGLTIGYDDGDTIGYNFADPSANVTPSVDAATIFDMTVALNTLGKSLRWTWVNGDILYWNTTDLGQDDATVHIKFRPALAPYIAHWSDNGCTATPIYNCAIAREDGHTLTATMVFSLDDTLDPALTGAVFATQRAIAGFLEPGGSPEAPTLDIQAASTHTTSEGSPQLGILEAFIPAAALVHLYGVLPADANYVFTTTRLGDAGTNDTPIYARWTAAENGADGLLVTVRNITFSVPRYRVSNKLVSARTRARVSGARTIVTATIGGCSRTRTCLVTVYDLGPSNTPRYLAARTLVLRSQALKTKTFSVGVRASRLKKGHRYLLVVRAAKGKRLLASALGMVR
ncbi:MAG: hypothetical protein ABR548_01800 [Actinomycetota bacterium]|nr:hypothetical protein [Actinomycetota bacterium]